MFKFLTGIESCKRSRATDMDYVAHEVVRLMTLLPDAKRIHTEQNMCSPTQLTYTGWDWAEERNHPKNEN